MRDIAILVLGILLGLVPGWLAKKRRLRTHWRALRAEMIQCSENALSVFDSQPLVMAPLYRLPLMAYQASFPVLLMDGAVSETEVRVLSRFYGQVQDINRGLDNAAAMNMAGNEAKLVQEFNRNRLKAQGLVQAKRGEPSLSSQALTIVDRRANQQWWRFQTEA
jgi:hypothetical protein